MWHRKVPAGGGFVFIRAFRRNPLNQLTDPIAALMSIIISQRGQKATRVDQSSFDKEAHLQEYIYDNPETIPLYEIKEDIKLLILAREFPTDSGPIDAIGVDKDGDIYLVETKFYKNPDKRWVVAQVLDYGASLWRSGMDFPDFIAKLNQSVEKKFKTGLNDKLIEFFHLESVAEADLMLENARRNLNEGVFKFVILMDKLHDRLKDLIVFLNQNSKFDVYAVELEYYKHETWEIMIPKLFGSEVKKDIAVNQQASGARRKWDETSFLVEAETKLSGGELMALKEIYAFSKKIADETTWGTGAARPSFQVKINAISGRSLYGVNCEGRLSLNFHWLNDTAEAEKFRDSFKNLIDANIPSWDIPKDYQTQFIKLGIKDWAGNLQEFKKVVEELISKR
jgi:hypothetical protein